MNAADIYKETNYVMCPTGQPVVIVPIKQRSEKDMAPSIECYKVCVALALVFASIIGLSAFIFLMIAVFTTDLEEFYTVSLWMFVATASLILTSVPCCFKLNRHQNMRIQQFMYRDGLDNLIA